MPKKPLKSYSLEEIQDKYIGKKGTLAREKYEHELSMGILGYMIKEARQKRKLTQEQLGKLAGVAKAQISQLERKANSASIGTIIKVFNTLDADISVGITLKNQSLPLTPLGEIIDPTMRSYANDPYFIKKAAEMKALIDKVGLPKEYYEKK